jgi:hypothetical protein
MKYFIFIGISLLFISACEEVIDIELNDEKQSRLVVDGRFTNQEKVHQIYLLRSTSYFSEEAAPKETGAQVNISSEDEEFPLTENSETPGLYETDVVKGTIGKTYTLDIVTKDGERFSSSLKMDTIGDIDSITYEYDFDPYFEYGYYMLKLYAYEPAPKGHTYMFDIYLNGVLSNDTLDETSYETDEFFNDTYLPGVDIYYFPQEYIVKETNHMHIDMLAISKEEYNYNNALLTETNYRTDLIGSMFSGPEANVPSNIVNKSGGVNPMGFFSVASVVSYDLIMYKEHVEENSE